MDILPLTTFVWSPAAEHERLAYTLSQLAHGFYQEKGFLLTHQLNGSAATVVLPRETRPLPVSIRDELMGQRAALPFELSTTVSEFIQDCLPGPTSLQARCAQLDEQWRSVEKVFWNFFRLLFADYEPLPLSVEVLVTSTGTIASFALLESVGSERLRCYLRADADISHLAEILLTAALERYASLPLAWEERESFVDTLLTTSQLRQLFPRYQPTLLSLTAKPERDETGAILLSLGFELPKQNIKEKNGEWEFGSIPLRTLLTKSEYEMLVLLLSAHGRVVSYDALADALELEEFSLWAINRLASRLRARLAELGASAYRLRSIYGQGYVLVSPQA